MNRHLTPRALKRAEWFKDLTAALEEAEKLLAILDANGGLASDTRRLRNRVQNVRTEVEILNRVMLEQGRVVGKSWPERMPTQTVER